MRGEKRIREKGWRGEDREERREKRIGEERRRLWR
jgi:hypothetical protein